MATIYDLKPRFQSSLRPLCRRLAAAGASANQVTLAAALLSVLHGAWIAAAPMSLWPLLCLPVTLFVRMALNALDGMMAREHGMKSRRGAILNEIGDAVSDAALYLPLGLVPGVPAPLVVAAVVAAILSEMTGILGQTIGTGRRYDGPMGKSDRAAAFGLFAVLVGAGVRPGWWSALYIAAIAGLAALTVLNRARAALAQGPLP